MKLRNALWVGAATTAAVLACSNDYNLVTADAGADAGAPDAAATTATTEAAAADTNVPAAVTDGGTPAIGVGCAITPAPSLCQDFEGAVDPATIFSANGATAAVTSPGSNSSKGLQIVCASEDSGSAGSYITNLAKTYSHLVWSFDLRMDAKVLSDTTVTALAVDGLAADGQTHCSLGVVRSDTGFDGVDSAPT